MRVNYWPKPIIPTAVVYWVTDDFGDEVFIGGTNGALLAWYFLDLYEAIYQC